MCIWGQGKEADAVIDCSGNAKTPDSLLACLGALRVRGILVLVGSQDVPVPLNTSGSLRFDMPRPVCQPGRWKGNDGQGAFQLRWETALSAMYAKIDVMSCQLHDVMQAKMCSIAGLKLDACDWNGCKCCLCMHRWDKEERD